MFVKKPDRDNLTSCDQNLHVTLNVETGSFRPKVVHFQVDPSSTGFNLKNISVSVQ